MSSGCRSLRIITSQSSPPSPASAILRPAAPPFLPPRARPVFRNWENSVTRVPEIQPPNRYFAFTPSSHTTAERQRVRQPTLAVSLSARSTVFVRAHRTASSAALSSLLACTRSLLMFTAAGGSITAAPPILPPTITEPFGGLTPIPSTTQSRPPCSSMASPQFFRILRRRFSNVRTRPAARRTSSLALSRTLPESSSSLATISVATPNGTSNVANTSEIGLRPSTIASFPSFSACDAHSRIFRDTL
mmetsp:Transcript_9783/g.26572  ORF Transcript_9783/g.26572 Transcript_9783/m.26572 type:complete len:247 (-) Transcript_9783:1295-2035(-)